MCIFGTLQSNVVLVFGYVSDVWKGGFGYDERMIGYIKDNRNCFQQAAAYVRGTPEFLGLVVTLEAKEGEITVIRKHTKYLAYPDLRHINCFFLHPSLPLKSRLREVHITTIRERVHQKKIYLSDMLPWHFARGVLAEEDGIPVDWAQYAVGLRRAGSAARRIKILKNT
ncbi:hypothetical protein M758_UG320900 [Ceratodon purpureus]|nr:hypothetical protein M758_UG320900 [Ceratodon purpureus]